MTELKTPSSPKVGNFRWTICALVFFATTVNYLDRSVISLLKGDLTKEFNWTDGDYADIEISFKLAYALGMLGAGRLIDKLGSKIGYFVATTLWSVAAIAHAAVMPAMTRKLANGCLQLLMIESPLEKSPDTPLIMEAAKLSRLPHRFGHSSRILTS